MATSTTVYAIHNHNTGEVYIGESVSPAFRLGQHRSMLRGGKHHNRALQGAYVRDGEQAFGFVILERCTDAGYRGAAWSTAQETRWCERARAAGIVLYNDQVGRARRQAA